MKKNRENIKISIDTGVYGKLRRIAEEVPLYSSNDLLLFCMKCEKRLKEETRKRIADLTKRKGIKNLKDYRRRPVISYKTRTLLERRKRKYGFRNLAEVVYYLVLCYKAWKRSQRKNKG